MTVSARYILAALAFGIAALGFLLLPVDADARTQRDMPQCSGSGGCGGYQPPPPCTHGCNPPPPPHCCDRPPVVVPPPHVPPPNIVVVNAGARASASAGAIAIAIANAGSGGDTIIRSNSIMQGSAAASVNSAALSVAESGAQGDAEGERELLIQAICLDATNNPHPASQTFGERDVAVDYRGEIYRCMAGTRMRYTMQNRSYDCAQGEALWYENGRVECRTQIVRRPCNERSLLRRFGAGDKFVAVRGAEQSAARTETTFNGAMTMDGGVGQGVW
jgi:hypothetical protein